MLKFRQLIQTSSLIFVAILTVASQGHATSRGLRCESVFSTEHAQLRAAQPRVRVRNFDDSHTLSQAVRDNAPDFWRFSKIEAKRYFGSLVNFEGLVIGDTHPGNFIVGPLNGRLRFHIADIKDAGRAPYILDFARLVTSTHAIFKRVDDGPKLRALISMMTDAYSAGLRNEPLPANLMIDTWLDSKVDDYETLASAYVERHTIDSKFKMKPGAIQPMRRTLRDNKIKAAIKHVIETQFEHATVLDFALRPRTRGGSKNLARYWALIKVGGSNRIVEFKEVGPPSVSYYSEDQAPTSVRYDDLMETFWRGKDTNIQIVKLGETEYLMRRKKIDLISFSYQPKSQKKQATLMGLAAYEAHYLGLLHARQLPSMTYVNELSLHRHEFEDGLRDFAKDYLEHLEGSLDDGDAS